VESVDLARLLLDLLIVVVAAKLAAEIAERLTVPAVLGEIVAGIAIGPSVLGLVELHAERGVSLGVLAELGALLLLVQVGLEMDLAELGRVGRASLLVAMIGVVVPFAAGTAGGIAIGWDNETSIFLGAALTATSVGITARVFGDLRALTSTEARIVLGAAVADDVLGLIILTVVVKVVSGEGVTVGVVASTILTALVFLALAGTAGLIAVPHLLAIVHRLSRSGATLSAVALGLILGFAVLADAAQLAFIIGAFMAGLAIGRSEHHERIAGDLNSIGSVLIPVFFVLIGVNADLQAMLEPSVLVDAGLLLVIAIAGKLVSAYGAIGLTSDRLLIGIGMIPRGEVGLIFASIGLSQGVLDDELYGALLLVVLLTTVITPPLLRWRIASRGPAIPPADEHAEAEPANGWVMAVDGQIALTAHPPSSSLADVALQTSTLATRASPSDALLDWFATRRDAPVAWTSAHTDELTEVLRLGNPRAVRLLEVTGILERGVPSVARAIARRRADPSELDPLGVLRFPTVDRLDTLLDRRAGNDARTAHRPHPPPPIDQRATILAALVVDVLGPDASPAAVRRLLDELDVGPAVPVEHIGRSARQLRAWAADHTGISQTELLQLANQIGSTATLTAATLLADATIVHGADRNRLAHLDEVVGDLLAHPELLGDGAADLATIRRIAAQRLCTDPASVDRLAAASDSYVLAHEPDELARQARLVEPAPMAGIVRVAVSPDEAADHWLIDVACRDSSGLLAHLAQALTDAGCDIVSATLATWPDGAAVDTFLVRSAVRPRARHLAETMKAALDRRLPRVSLTHAVVEVDNVVLPWHTSCTVSGADRPGTLATLAAAFTAAGVVVHSARLTTLDGHFVDRFAVSDRLGRKLDQRAVARLQATVSGEARRRGRRT
jgi:Kef-type K+ transport system membrane component KefB/glycine cleavage system regulatory protein